MAREFINDKCMIRISNGKERLSEISKDRVGVEVYDLKLPLSSSGIDIIKKVEIEGGIDYRYAVQFRVKSLAAYNDVIVKAIRHSSGEYEVIEYYEGDSNEYRKKDICIAHADIDGIQWSVVAETSKNGVYVRYYKNFTEAASKRVKGTSIRDKSADSVWVNGAHPETRVKFVNAGKDGIKLAVEYGNIDEEGTFFMLGEWYGTVLRKVEGRYGTVLRKVEGRYVISNERTETLESAGMEDYQYEIETSGEPFSKMEALQSKSGGIRAEIVHDNYEDRITVWGNDGGMKFCSAKPWDICWGSSYEVMMGSDNHFIALKVKRECGDEYYLHEKGVLHRATAVNKGTFGCASVAQVGGTVVTAKVTLEDWVKIEWYDTYGGTSLGRVVLAPFYGNEMINRVVLNIRVVEEKEYRTKMAILKIRGYVDDEIVVTKEYVILQRQINAFATKLIMGEYFGSEGDEDMCEIEEIEMIKLYKAEEISNHKLFIP